MQSIHLKRKLSKFWPAQKIGRKIILLYHSVNDGPWATTKANFVEQINWISEHCEVHSLSSLLNAKPSKKIQVAFTFDDGYVSLYENILPIFSHQEITPTVYLNTGWISDTSKNRKKSVTNLGHYPQDYFLTWSEVKELQKANWEIGSHGVNHLDFTKINPDLMKQELFDSKLHIENQLKIPCIQFSYPWGRHNSLVRQTVRELGYQYAVSARHKNLAEKDDLCCLPRINIAREYTMDDFKNIINGKWDYINFIHLLRRIR